MSHNISNTYAARIFAEHPLALWSLDDDLYFISLLSSSQLDPSNWIIEDARAEWLAVEEYFTPQNLPVKTSQSGVLSKTTAASVSYAQIHSASIQYSSLDPSKDTICISSFVWEYGSSVDYYEIGFLYSNGIRDSIIAQSLGNGPWQKIEYTSEIPSGITSIMPFVRVYYADAAPGEDIMFNSLTVGQWSEEYLLDSQGSVPENLGDLFFKVYLPNTSYQVIPLDAYGFSDQDTGYAIVDNKKLLARNKNLPIVYGAANLTEINSPITSGMPSLVFPGKGFLNQNGQYAEMTAEFWLRVNPINFVKTRIFGPVASNDGLYVDNEFLTLQIGNYSKSYFVGKWFRPMLIDIRYTQNLAHLLINGDVAIEMNIDTSSMTFPAVNTDWIGFYGNENLKPFDIDALAIYPYVVPDQVAKRRFIYGQGVVAPETVINNFNGQSLFIDFPFANYSSTINYPDMNAWNSGYFNNLEANSRYLTFKEYDEPSFRFVGEFGTFTGPIDSRDWDEFQQKIWLEWLSYTWQGVQNTTTGDILSDNFINQISGSPAFLEMRPTSAYSEINGSIEFENINPITDRVSSIYGVFQAPPVITSTPQVLMYLYNSVNSNTFTVQLNNEGLKYLYNDILIHQETVSASSNFIAGFDIDKLTQYNPNTIGNFFSNPQNISMSLMGYGNSTFLGKLFSISFDNSFYTHKDIESKFSQDGVVTNTVNGDAFDYIGNYTVKPIKDDNGLTLAVCSSGYWEDSIPLSYFGKRVKDSSGLEYYDLDMVQFNLEYPFPIFTNPSASTGFLDDVNVKAYITLQDVETVGKIAYSTYTDIVQLDSTRVLDFDNTIDVIETKFEITDGTIIFPPKELVNFEDYYITIHLEVEGIDVNNKPIQIKKMSLSSVAQDQKDFFAINTKTGNKMYPISRYDKTYSYKDKNPFKIYTESTPYLYLTGDSGISLLPYDSTATRGFSIPLNSNKVPTYYLGGVQFWGMYNKDSSINQVEKIGRISTPDRIFDLYLDPIDNGKRALLKAFDAETGLIADVVNVINDDIVFYQDGSRIKYPVIEPLKWTSIVISVGAQILLNSVSGQFELYEGFVYNNIASFQKTSQLFGQSIDARIWQEVRRAEIVVDGEILTFDYEWTDWTPYDWYGVYAPSTTPVSFNLNGSDVIKSYLGTSSIVCDDESIININSEGVDLISNVVWNTTFVKPV